MSRKFFFTIWCHKIETSKLHYNYIKRLNITYSCFKYPRKIWLRIFLAKNVRIFGRPQFRSLEEIVRSKVYFYENRLLWTLFSLVQILFVWHLKMWRKFFQMKSEQFFSWSQGLETSKDGKTLLKKNQVPFCWIQSNLLQIFQIIFKRWELKYIE